MTTKNVPAKQEENSVVPLKTGLTTLTEQELRDMQGVEGAGLTDSVEDRGTALIYIAQKATPQVEERDAKYVKGLKPGMVFNNLTGEFWDAEREGFSILPCFTRTTWDEWTPRDSGSGYHGSHSRNTELLKSAKPFVTKKGKTRRDIFILPNGHELKFTQKYYCVIPETWTPIVIPMTSTNLGAAVKLQALISAQKAQVGNKVIIKPAFWQIYNLRTTYESDAEYSWFQFAVDQKGPLENPDLKEFCKQFALACQRNEITEAKPATESSTGSPDDKDIPI